MYLNDDILTKQRNEILYIPYLFLYKPLLFSKSVI